jgi:predicted XRE-type DNA-binding protein
MKKRDYKISSGNLYADLNYANPEELQAKSELAREIYLIIQSKGMKQKEVGKLLAISQPKVSNLLNGRLSGFSLERLTRFLNILDYDVDIFVKPKPENRAAHTSISSNHLNAIPVAAKKKG